MLAEEWMRSLIIVNTGPDCLTVKIFKYTYEHTDRLGSEKATVYIKYVCV